MVRKRGGIRGYFGGKSERIAVLSKRRILVVVTLGSQ